MTTTKGIIRRVQHHAAPWIHQSGTIVPATSVHLAIDVDLGNDQVQTVDVVGFAWDFAALGVALEGDEVLFAHNSDFRLTSFEITIHW
jgi:hypothetical protein